MHETLRKVKVFLGLGFPIEGPAPFEAIANGWFLVLEHLSNGAYFLIIPISTKSFDRGRDRTYNLLLRRQTRYPLRHAAGGSRFSVSVEVTTQLSANEYCEIHCLAFRCCIHQCTVRSTEVTSKLSVLQ